MFAYEISSGNVSLVTRSASNPGATADVDCGALAISGDGRSAAFLCRGTDLVPGQVDVNPYEDTFLADLGSGQVVLVSHAASLPVQTGDGRSEGSPSISGDGRYVVFASTARDLIAGQTEPAGYPDVFLYDRSSGQVTRVTTSAAAPQAANHASYAPVISENGRTIAFLSLASDLVPGQIDPVESMDVFVYDVRTGTTALANWAGTPVTPGRGLVWNVLALSADGAALGFSSDALDLVPFDFNGRSDAFVVPIERD